MLAYFVRLRGLVTRQFVLFDEGGQVGGIGAVVGRRVFVFVAMLQEPGEGVVGGVGVSRFAPVAVGFADEVLRDGVAFFARVPVFARRGVIRRAGVGVDLAQFAVSVAVAFFGGDEVPVF